MSDLSILISPGQSGPKSQKGLQLKSLTSKLANLCFELESWRFQSERFPLKTDSHASEVPIEVLLFLEPFTKGERGHPTHDRGSGRPLTKKAVDWTMLAVRLNELVIRDLRVASIQFTVSSSLL